MKISARMWLMLLAVTILAAEPAAAQGRTTHQLPLTPENIHWGCYDASLEPVVTVRSGDRIYFENMLARGLERLRLAGIADARFLPSMIAVEEAETVRVGSHPLNGPIYVEGAEPGDVLEVRFVDSTAPGYHVGNLDNKDLIEGTTLFLPVHAAGGLLSIGDPHALHLDGTRFGPRRSGADRDAARWLSFWFPNTGSPQVTPTFCARWHSTCAGLNSWMVRRAFTECWSRRCSANETRHQRIAPGFASERSAQEGHEEADRSACGEYGADA